MSQREPKLMYVFPGQGAQYRSMGKDLWETYPAARATYELASETLGYDVADLSFRDPDSLLNVTSYTQPALLTHSVACLAAFQDLSEESVKPSIVAGHSLGEYSAMVAADVLSFQDALRLVKRRGELMSEFGTGQMLAVSMELSVVREFAERHFCGIGGCNLPEQTVVGGLEKDLDALAEELRKESRKARPTRLKTGGAFHTYLMVDAAMHFRKHLEEADFKAPSCRILSNYTGDFHGTNPDSFRSRLFYQLFNPVRWAWGMRCALEEGASAIVEFGGGVGGESPETVRPNLASIVKRTTKAQQGRFGRRATDSSKLGYQPMYSHAINVDSIAKSAHLVAALRRTTYASADDAPEANKPLASNCCRLFVPTVGGVPVGESGVLMGRVQELGLGDRIEIIAEDASANVAFISSLDSERTEPSPYLATSGGDTTAAPLHVLGEKEIEAELVRLHEE